MSEVLAPESSTCCDTLGDDEQRHTSVYLPAHQDYTCHPDAWKGLSSKIRWSKRVQEFVIEWDESENDEKLIEIAENAIGQTQDWFANKSEGSSMRALDLSSSLQCFVEHCRSNLINIRSYKLKLSSAHGPSATRCPLWHADSVPVRWIQSYLGPGCVYLNEDEHIQFGNNDFDPFLQRIRDSDPDIESKQLGDNWKQKLVQSSGISISQSPTGEATMLVGRLWPFVSNNDIPTVGPTAGVLHRSPHNIPRGQDRILLNLDVVCHSGSELNQDEEDDHDHSNCDCAKC